MLHGNVHDLVRCSDGPAESYCNLPEFLATQIFGRWDLVLGYDLSQGLRPQAGSDAERLRTMQQQLTTRWGEPASWPRDADAVLLLLDGFIERNLVDPAARKSIAMLVRLCRNTLSRQATWTPWPAARRRDWSAFCGRAQNPLIKQVNMAFLPGRRPFGRSERAAGAKPARGDDRNAACPTGTSGAASAKLATRGQDLAGACRFLAPSSWPTCRTG